MNSTQEPHVGSGKFRHIDAGPPAAQARDQRDRQHLEKVAVCRGVRPEILDRFGKLKDYSITVSSFPDAAAAFGEVLKRWRPKMQLR